LTRFTFVISLFLICLGLASGLSVQDQSKVAQDQTKVAEPEYIEQFLLLDSTGALKPLERELGKPSPEFKGKVLGMDGTYSYLISGSRSPVRIVEGTDLSVIIRLASREIDPATVVQLFRLNVKGDNRELQIWKMITKGRSVKTKTTQEDSAIPFEATKYGEKSFRIKPKIDLHPGEYSFSLTTSQDGYCFGIDKAPTSH
jgi:hypothetical protein